MDALWATKNEAVGLIVRAISFLAFQPIYVAMNLTIHQRHGRTDRRLAIAIPRFALKCIAADRAVKKLLVASSRERESLIDPLFFCQRC